MSRRLYADQPRAAPLARRMVVPGVCAALAACGSPLPIDHFDQTTPPFDPVAFFTGHVTSYGVMEDRAGQPVAEVRTDCDGQTGPDGVLHMTQTLHIGDDPPQTRDWTLTPAGSGRWVGHAGDMDGDTTGTASGRAFHWRWSIRHSPADYTLDQWWYALDDHSMLNRTTIRVAGVVVRQVSEHFVRIDPKAPPA